MTLIAGWDRFQQRTASYFIKGMSSECWFLSLLLMELVRCLTSTAGYEQSGTDSRRAQSCMLKTITARALITVDSEISFPVLHLDEDGRLLEISSDPRALSHETTILGSALLDVHMHG